MSNTSQLAHNPLYGNVTLSLNLRNTSEQEQQPSDADATPIMLSKSERLTEKSNSQKLRKVRCVVIALTILVLLLLVCILGVFMFIFHHRLTEMEMRNRLPITGNVSHTWNTTTTIPGLIADADTGQPLPNASITTTLLNTLSETFTTHTNIDGEFELPITPNLKYTVSFHHPGYRPLEIPQFHIKTVDNIPCELPISLISTQFDTTDQGVVVGRVLEGNTTVAIENVRVMLKNGLWNEKGGVIGETVTGFNGTWYAVLQTGHYTACFEKAGYMADCVGLVALGGKRTYYTTTRTQRMRYIFEANTVRFVLEWENSGADLEGILTSPTGSVSRSVAKICSQPPCRNTLTIANQLPGKYTYSVGIVTPVQPHPWLLAAVEAKVTVFINDQVDGYYHVPHRNGTIWNVVELVGNKLTFTNILL